MGDYVAAQTLHDLVCADGCLDLGDAYDASVRFSQGVAHMHDREWAQAAEHFRSVIAMAPRYANAHVRLCVALANLGRLGEAQRCLDRARRLNPTEPLLASVQRMLREWRSGAAPSARIRPAPAAGHLG